MFVWTFLLAGKQLVEMHDLLQLFK